MTQNLEPLLAEARDVEMGEGPEAALKLLLRHESYSEVAMYRFALGSLRYRVGQRSEALADFEAAHRLQPRVAEYLANIGFVLLDGAMSAGPHKGVDSDQLTQALQRLEAAAKLGPKVASVYTSLGLARELSGDAAGSLLALERAIELAPDDPRPRYNMAATLFAVGDQLAARACLDALLSDHPDFEPARLSLERMA